MSNREILALLPVFDAVLAEGSLSRAAERLGVTQPAVSHALGRLRKLTNDPLFESTGHGMRPTPRALQMAEHVRSALAHADAIVARTEVDIASLDRSFVIDMGAGFDALIVPLLFAEIAKLAPRVRLIVSSTRGSDLPNDLKYAQTALAFDFTSSTESDIRCERLAQGAPVVLARQGHPDVVNGLSEDLYMKLPHVALLWHRGSGGSAAALELERIGRERRVVLSVPTLMAIGAVVASSDLLATTSTFVGRQLVEHFRIQVCPMPFQMASLGLYQLWHARFEDDPVHKWLRGTVRDLAKRISGPV